MNLILVTMLLATGQCGTSSCGTPYRAPVTYARSEYHYEPEIRYQRVLAVIPLLDLPSYSAYFQAPLPPPAGGGAAGGAAGVQGGPPPGLPPGGPPNPASLQVAGRGLAPDKLDEILSLLQRLDVRVRVLEGGAPVKAPSGAPPPAPPPGPAKESAATTKAAPPAKGALAVFQAKCILCHEASVAHAKVKGKEKGGGLVLLKDEGKTLAPLTDKQKNRVLVMSYQGRMPPHDSGVPALTDQEVGAIVDEFSK